MGTGTESGPTITGAAGRTAVRPYGNPAHGGPRHRSAGGDSAPPLLDPGRWFLIADYWPKVGRQDACATHRISGKWFVCALGGRHECRPYVPSVGPRHALVVLECRGKLGACGSSSMAEPQPSKLATRVRFPSPAGAPNISCLPPCSWYNSRSCPHSSVG